MKFKRQTLVNLEEKLKTAINYLILSYTKANKSTVVSSNSDVISVDQIKHLLVINIKYYLSLYRTLFPSLHFNISIATIYNDSLSFVLEDYSEFTNKQWVSGHLKSQMNLCFPLEVRENKDAFFIFSPADEGVFSVDSLVVDRLNNLSKVDIGNIKTMANKEWPDLYKEVCIHYQLAGIQ